jgi:hypothetical protein
VKRLLGIFALVSVLAVVVGAEPSLSPEPETYWKPELGVRVASLRQGAWYSAAMSRPALHALLLQGVAQTSVPGTTGSGGNVSAGGTNNFTGTVTVIDGSFGIVGSSDATKIARFEVDGFTAANTRIFTLPGTTGNDTLVTLASTDAITGLKEFSGQTNISGPDSTTNVEIGSTANDANGGTGGTSVVIGNAADNNGNGAGTVLIGSTATKGAGANSVIIGAAAVGGASASQVVIGAAATASASSANNVVIGPGATVAGGSGNNVVISGTAGAATTGGSNVVLGSQATAGAANNAFVSGGLTTPINDVYFGKGITNATATAYTIHGGGGTGTDNAGGNLLLAGGISTGTGRGGDTIIQTVPSAAGTGSAANALTDRMRVVGKAVALTDGATSIVQITGLGAHVRSGGSIDFCVQAADASNDQVACGRSYWAAVDTTAGAGGETCANLLDGLTVSAAVSGAASSGTLTVTTDATTGTDVCNLRITPTGSLTETTYNVYYTVQKQLPSGTIVPQ